MSIHHHGYPMTSNEGQVDLMNEEEEEQTSLSGAVEALAISSEAAEGGGSKDGKDTHNNTGGVKDGGLDDANEEEEEDLFKPPPKKECSLCFIPLPISQKEMGYHSCCGQIICNGCAWKHDQVLAATNAKRALKDPPKPPLANNCAFCRAPPTKNDEVVIKRIKARMALSDAKAFEALAGCYQNGILGLPRDETREFELRFHAAELGSASSCYNISCTYRDKDGVESNDVKREHYLKLAARKGHILARHNLGCFEVKRGNIDIAVRHWMISASAGHDESLKAIGLAYRKRYATKDQFEEAIRANHAAKKETQSEERDKAKAVYGDLVYV